MAEEEKAFKWKKRSLTTTMAERLVQEEGLTPEEAVERVLDVTEGVAYLNRELLSERRLKNFIKRVGENRKYKNFTKEVPVIALLNDKVKGMVESKDLTELQATVFSTLVRLMEDSEGDLSTVTLEDLSEYMLMKPERVRGFLSTLRQKELIRIDKVDTDAGKETIYLLSEKGKDLAKEDVKTKAN